MVLHKQLIPPRAVVMSVLAVALSAMVLNVALSWVAENWLADMEAAPGAMGEMISMLRMHHQAPVSTSILMGLVAALACLIGAPVMAMWLKRGAKMARL